MKVHQRIRHYINENGWNINFVAKKVGIKESRFYRIVNGDAPLTTEEYEVICQGMGVSPDYFFKDFFLDFKNNNEKQAM